MPESHMTKDHMKAILSGRKKLFNRRDIKFVVVPKYDEISVKCLYDKFV